MLSWLTFYTSRREGGSTGGDLSIIASHTSGDVISAEKVDSWKDKQVAWK